MKTIVLDCIELLVADGCGGRDNHFAYVSNTSVAEAWERQEPTYRTVKKYNKTITIFDTLEELEDSVKQSLIKSAKSKLNRDELKALGLS